MMKMNVDINFFETMLKKLSYNVKVKFLFGFLMVLMLFLYCHGNPCKEAKLIMHSSVIKKKLTCYCCDFTFVINTLIRNSNTSKFVKTFMNATCY